MRKVNDLPGLTSNPDAYLTNYSFNILNEDQDFIVGAASSRIPVQTEAGKFNVYLPGYFLRDEAQVRPLGGRPVQVGYGVTTDNYYAEEWALEHTIDDRQRRNARDQLRLDESATRLLTTKQKIRAERIWATSFFGTGKWAMEVAGEVGVPGVGEFKSWSDDASDPIANVEEWKERIAAATGLMPNVLVLGVNVRKRLKLHPDLIERRKYTTAENINNQSLANLFEVDQVRIARSIYNSAEERLPGDDRGGENFQYIIDPNGAWLGYIDPNPTLDSPTAIANFAWDALVPGQTNDFGGVISRGRDGRAYSDYFHSRQAFGLKKISDDLGLFISAATTG